MIKELQEPFLSRQDLDVPVAASCHGLGAAFLGQRSPCPLAWLPCSRSARKLPWPFRGRLIKEEADLSDKAIRLIKVQLGLWEEMQPPEHMPILLMPFGAATEAGFVLAAAKPDIKTCPCCTDGWREPRLLSKAAQGCSCSIAGALPGRNPPGSSQSIHTNRAAGPSCVCMCLFV